VAAVAGRLVKSYQSERRRRGADSEAGVSGTNSFRLPAWLEVGPGSLARLGPGLAELGVRRAFVVSDVGVRRAGLLERVARAVEEAGVAAATHAEMAGEPTVETVRATLAAFRRALGTGGPAGGPAGGPGDAVVGVGGGSVLDVCKAVAALATNGGDIEDYWGIDRFSRPALPKVLIPTTAGTGSEVTRFAVFTDEREAVKKVASSGVLLPELAVVDAELTLSLPPRVTADSGMDALAHAVEAYLGRAASPFSDALAERAVALVAEHLRAAVAAPGPAAREGMTWASTLAGMAFNAAGLGAVHALGYPLDTHFGVPHGRTNAVLLPHVLRFNRVACEGRVRRLAELAGASDFVDWVERLLADLDIAPRLRDYGVPREQAAGLGREGWETGQRLLGNNPRAMSAEDAEEVYEGAW
jgi:alcohol dehydrogenase class IV